MRLDLCEVCGPPILAPAAQSDVDRGYDGPVDGFDWDSEAQLEPWTLEEALEALGEPDVTFHEVWNLVKPVNGSSGWLLGGIQQLA